MNFTKYRRWRRILNYSSTMTVRTIFCDTLFSLFIDASQVHVDGEIISMCDVFEI